MGNNYGIQVVIIFLIGYVLAYYTYNKYKTNIVIKETSNIYFLQEGVYTAKNVINKITVPSIIEKDGNKYYRYLGMTLDKNNANKIKELYKKGNIDLYIKEMNIDNSKFISELMQYDILLNSVENEKELINILDTILSTYEEVKNNL